MDRLTSSESVVVVVVPRDRFSMFPHCLDALFAHTNVQFRIIVVAGGLDEQTKHFLNRIQVDQQNISVVIADRLLMPGEARNLALKQVNERFCVILENDTIVHENWLTPLLECLKDEGAAVVTPMITWYRGMHAAGCMFQEREQNGATLFDHQILYTGIHRKRIDYPENHCILIDRTLLKGADIFEDVEPFDVDLGLTLRKYGFSVFLEPRSAVTYSAPPPLEVRDIPVYKSRWNPVTWRARNQLFMKKWGVAYNPSKKCASYRRALLKLGIARWFPTKFTVELSNVGVRTLNRLISVILPT